jgi:hypothetical protein
MALHISVVVDYPESAGLADFGIADDEDDAVDLGDEVSADLDAKRTTAPSPAPRPPLHFDRVGSGPASALQVCCTLVYRLWKHAFLFLSRLFLQFRVFSVDLLLPPLPHHPPPPPCAHPRHWQGTWMLRSNIPAHTAASAAPASALVDSKDAYAWLPSQCTPSLLSTTDLLLCLRQRRRIFLAGSSQQRTLFFDLASAIGSTQNQPRK